MLPPPGPTIPRAESNNMKPNISRKDGYNKCIVVDYSHMTNNAQSVQIFGTHLPTTIVVIAASVNSTLGMHGLRVKWAATHNPDLQKQAPELQAHTMGLRAAT